MAGAGNTVLVENRAKCGFEFPSLVFIDVGETKEVPEADFDHPVVAAWLDEGRVALVGPCAEPPVAPAKKAKG